MLDALAQLWRGAIRRRAKWALVRPAGADLIVQPLGAPFHARVAGSVPNLASDSGAVPPVRSDGSISDPLLK